LLFKQWPCSRRYAVYSAHDTTLAAVLAALGLDTNVDRPGFVPFSSALIFELWQQQKSSKGPKNKEEKGKGKAEFYVKVWWHQLEYELF
jgi:hypothetical protein